MPFITRMEIFTKESGSIAKLMVSAFTLIIMEPLMKATGLRTSKMGMEHRNGQMVVDTKASLRMAKSTVKELIFGRMGVITQVHGLRISYLDLVNING